MTKRALLVIFIVAMVFLLTVKFSKGESLGSEASKFIGSKVSLISKSQIRYEGTLYSLDLKDATISLAKVRSFGTEDRPVEFPIPVKDEIYEFIIFRGSDIRAIDLIEPPAPPENTNFDEN